MKYKIIIIFIIIALIAVGCSNQKLSTLSQQEKLEDFNQLYKEIQNGYPFLEVNKRQNKEDWIANKESYKQIVMKTSSDQDFANKLNAVIKDLNNGHTEVVTNKGWFEQLKETYEPLGWYDFFEDENVKNMYNSLENGQGYGNENYSDIKLKDIVKGKIGCIYIPQMNSANGNIDEDMKRIESYINKIQDYESLVIDIRGNYGGTDEYWVKLVSLITDKTYNCGGYRLFRNTSDVISKYAKSRDVELKNIDDLPKELLKNAPKEVTSMFTHFEYNNEVIEGKSKNPFKGKIYLLVDEGVFSGGESFAIFCKEQKFATIIGTKTGGDGYIYDPVLFKLNNSGLIVRMASNMYLTESGICNEEEKTTPNIQIKNYSEHNKPQLHDYTDKILELSKK